MNGIQKRRRAKALAHAFVAKASQRQLENGGGPEEGGIFHGDDFHKEVMMIVQRLEKRAEELGYDDDEYFRAPI